MCCKLIILVFCLAIAVTCAFPADAVQSNEQTNGAEVVAVAESTLSDDAPETQAEGDADLKGANTLYYGGLGFGYPYVGGGYYGGYYPQRIGYGGYYGGYPGGFGGGYPGGFGGGYPGGFGGGYYPQHHHGFGRRSGFGGFYY